MRLLAQIMLTLCAMSAAMCVHADNTPAKQVLWRVESKRSEVQFRLRALSVIGIEGSMGNVQGEIWRDVHGRWVQLRVPLQQLQMSNEENRRWALSPEFFDAARHPQLIFTAALPDDERVPEGALDGVLQLRGIEAPVRVQILPRRCSDTASACEVLADSEVSRRRFGMRTRRYVVSDKVKLKLSLHLARQ